MGELSLSRRDAIPSFQDVLRPHRDGSGIEPTASPQWLQPSFSALAPAEVARPRLPSIREMLRDTETAEYNSRNAGPSPSTVADSPGPATPGGHYTHTRHGSWPRVHSVDFFGAVEDRSAVPGRSDLPEGVDLGRFQEDEFRYPDSPRSHHRCYSPQRAWQLTQDTAWEPRSNHALRERSDAPRVVPPSTRPSEHWPADWRPVVAERDREQREELEEARRRRIEEQRRYTHAAQPDNGCWTTTLALRDQTVHANDSVRIAQRPMIIQRAPIQDPRPADHAVVTRDFRSRSDIIATSSFPPSGRGHSRSASFLHDRTAPWHYGLHDDHPYRVAAGGPGNPFAVPNSFGGYHSPPGYHLAGHMERGDGAGQLAEMAKRKKRGNLPPEAKRMMMAWFKTNLHHPYPDEETKKKWIAETGLSPEQISNYCINARRRDIKNMRHEAGLSPQMASETSPNADVLNHRKRRSSDESAREATLIDIESDKRRRRH